MFDAELPERAVGLLDNTRVVSTSAEAAPYFVAAEALRRIDCTALRATGNRSPTWYTPIVPKRTIYIRDADLPMWKQAEAIAGENLSAFLAAALRDYLERPEFREISMAISQHGQVTKRVLHVWGSRLDDGRTAWGTSFDSDGTGPDQAAALVSQMKADPTIRHIELEERRVYADNWVDRTPLEEWSRPEATWERIV